MTLWTLTTHLVAVWIGAGVGVLGVAIMLAGRED